MKLNRIWLKRAIIDESRDTVAVFECRRGADRTGYSSSAPWRLEDDPVASGWSRLANTFARHQLEKELVTVGWTFFFMASPITTTAVGMSRLRMFHAALARLIAASKAARMQLLGDRRCWGAFIPWNTVPANFGSHRATSRKA